MVRLASHERAGLYADRFHGEAEGRNDIWRVLCSRWFQRWVPADATVLDVAAGHCEFINNIRAGTRIAVDLNPEVASRAESGVRTYVSRSDDLRSVEEGSVDVAFVSNFFEHVSRDVILSTLKEIRRVLSPQGRLLILQPNVRYCARNYWQYFDHITAIDDRALCEALRATGYDVEKCVPRFLPYTTKGHLPAAPFFVRLYLRVPIAWRVMGAQAFIVAVPSARVSISLTPPLPATDAEGVTATQQASSSTKPA